MHAVIEWLTQVVALITQKEALRAGLIGWIIGYALCPGYVYFLAVFVELRWPKYKEQFKGLMPGNLFLGLVFGSACYLYAEYRASRTVTEVSLLPDGAHMSVTYTKHPWLFDTDFWYWIPIGFALLVVVALNALDVYGAATYKPGDTNKFTWRQMFSPTKVWHNVFVYGIYGFLLVKVGVPGLFSAPWASVPNTIARLILLGSLGRWLAYLWHDAKVPMHRVGHAHVPTLQIVWGYAVIAITLWLAVAYTPLLAQL